MPGGFHPFHAGHYALYQSARAAFPNADVYVAATNDTSERPFPFAVKEKLAQLAGIPKGRFVQVKSPFGAEEITSRYDPDNTELIFVKSEKNSRTGASPEGPFPAEPDPKTGQLPLVTRGPRKGLPVSDRLQYYRPDQHREPMSRHSYLAYLPTVEFGPGMTSGSQIRAAWPKLNEKRKTALIMSLYPKTQANPNLAANVVKMLDTAIGTEVSEQRHEPSDPELRKTRAYARGHYTGVEDDPELAFDKWVQRSLMHSSQDDKAQDKILKSLVDKVKKLELQLQQLEKKPVEEDINRRGFLRGMGAAAAAGVASSALAAEPGNQQRNPPSDKPVTIAYVTIDGQVRQFNLGTRFNSSREAAEFIDKVLADKGLSGYTIQIKRGYTNENQGWAATFTNENSGQTAGFGSTGGMTATYQQRYNQPVDESLDYINEACKK